MGMKPIGFGTQFCAKRHTKTKKKYIGVDICAAEVSGGRRFAGQRPRPKIGKGMKRSKTSLTVSDALDVVVEALDRVVVDF